MPQLDYATPPPTTKASSVATRVLCIVAGVIGAGLLVLFLLPSTPGTNLWTYAALTMLSPVFLLLRSRRRYVFMLLTLTAGVALMVDEHRSAVRFNQRATDVRLNTREREIADLELRLEQAHAATRPAAPLTAPTSAQP